MMKILMIDLSDSMTVFCMIKASKPEKDSISLCQTYQNRLIHCDVGNKSGLKKMTCKYI